MKKSFLPALIAFLILCNGVSLASTAPDPLSPIQQLYILKEIRPDVERVGIIWTKNSPQHDALMPRVQRAASASGVKVFVAYVQGMRDVAPSYRTLRNEHNIDVLWVLEDDDTVGGNAGRSYLIRQATQQGIPLLAPTSDWVDAGAPISLQKMGGGIKVLLNEAAAAATALTVPDKYETQYLTTR